MSDARTPVTSPDLPVPPRARDLAPVAAVGRAARLLFALPDTPFLGALQITQRPTLPGRGVVDRSLVTRERIQGADRTAGSIPVTWIDRARAGDAAIVHLHGGAYVLGETPSHWAWLEELRRRSGTAAAMVHYRMPPRHPFPRALEDAAAAVEELLHRTVLRDGRWILSGDSAGGGLALALAQRLRDAGERGPAGILLTSPWTDLTMTDPSQALQEPRDLVLSRASLARAARHYAGAFRLEDARLSPRFGDMTGLAPVHLLVGADDLLLGDARATQAALVEAGVEVDHHELEGAPHDYPILIQGPAAQWAMRRQVEFVRRRLGLA
ncbi:alpha/beta hydrolase fold domain-containing protein [Brachybacterium hainanense]|uniref:Alpha/beta hydrolase fold domain-containing protein n=1 Tax=Brachybacterium hainanense TaxID=1541174 RepID=A0ABV6R7A5_9MICO